MTEFADEVPGPDGDGATAGVDRRLLDAIVAVASGLELEPTLRRIVHAAAGLTGAPYAALGVLGPDGLHQEFVHTGMDAAAVAAIGYLPRGRGLLGYITHARHPVRLDDFATHPASVGLPPGHPPMDAFLGVPVGAGGRSVGNLYLGAKPGGFTRADEDLVVALAAAAGVAVDNARLYEAAQRREAWVGAAQEIATGMLSGAEVEDALQLVARRARELSRADVSALVLPGWGGQWVLEVTDGEDADGLIGTVMPLDGRSARVIASGTGMRSEAIGVEKRVSVPALRRFGPAIHAPLIAEREPLGVLLLLRAEGSRAFTDHDLATAERFAGQAALTLRLAENQQRAKDAELLEQRQQIARDLHDLVVQELFALGMRLRRLGRRLPDDAVPDLESSLESLNLAMTEIRASVHALRSTGEQATPTGRLLSEVVRARETLGFLPEVGIRPSPEDVDARLPQDLADDVVAVVREALANVARHAGAGWASVRVTADGEQLLVEVEDDGRGLPADGCPRSGLVHLAERAWRHGGEFSVGARTPRGTWLRWRVAPV